MGAYALALALTIVLEVPVYTFGLTRCGGRTWRDAARTGLMVNVVSHPLAFVVAHPLLDGPIGDDAALAVVEVAVVVGEALLVFAARRASFVVALTTSAGANAVSLVIGVALTSWW